MENEMVDRISEVGPTAWAVYCVMVRHADQSTRTWPSTESIGTRIGSTSRTVRRGIETLLSAGWIGRIWRRSSRSREYCIIPPKEPDTSVRSDRSGHQCPPTAVSKRTSVSVQSDTGVREPHSVITPRRRLKKKTKGETPLPPFEFPPALDTPEVRRAAQEWLDHHRAIGKPYKKPIAQFKKLFKQFTEAAAFVAAVDFSIGNNYQGLIAPGEKHGSRKTTDRRSSRY